MSASGAPKAERIARDSHSGKRSSNARRHLMPRARPSFLTPFGTPGRGEAHLREYIRLAAVVLGLETLRRPMLQRPPSQHGRQLLDSLGFRTKAATQRRVEYAKQVTRAVAERFGVPLPSIALRFAALDGHAGQIRFRDGTWYVDINESYRWSDEGLTAVLAHEFAHAVLGMRRIELRPQDRNEELTDAVAALAGFGIILARACERTQTEYGLLTVREVTHRLGYLRRPDLLSLIAIQDRIARDIPKRRLTVMSIRTASHLACLCCGSPIRLPDIDARIRVRCLVCGLRHDLRIQPGGAVPSPSTLLPRIAHRIAAAIDRANGFSSLSGG